MAIFRKGPSAKLTRRKRALRQQMRLRLATMNSAEIMQNSSRIGNHLHAMQEYKKARTIVFYAGLPKEVQTLEMIEKAIAEGRVVGVPITRLKAKRLDIGRIDTAKDLAPRKIGKLLLLEPQTYRPIKAAEVDLVVVPGIAFDIKGGRLGRGPGFYDRFLATVPKEVPFVGLAFQNQVSLTRVPRERHDVRLDYIITENGVIRKK